MLKSDKFYLSDFKYNRRMLKFSVLNSLYLYILPITAIYENYHKFVPLLENVPSAFILNSHDPAFACKLM